MAGSHGADKAVGNQCLFAKVRGRGSEDADRNIERPGAQAVLKVSHRVLAVQTRRGSDASEPQSHRLDEREFRIVGARDPEVSFEAGGVEGGDVGEERFEFVQERTKLLADPFAVGRRDQLPPGSDQQRVAKELAGSPKRVGSCGR